MEGDDLPDSRRRELFVALVAAQDSGLGVRSSRQAVSQQCGVDAETVAEVEEEGLDEGWPPLGRA